VSTLLSLYYVARYAPATEPLVQEALTRAFGAEHAIVRGMAITASTVLSGAPPSRGDLQADLREMFVGLAAYGTKPGRLADVLEPWGVFGWNIYPHYWAAHLLGDPGLGLRTLITDALIEAARALEDRACGAVPGQLVSFVLRWHLPPRDEERGLVSPAELTQEQLALLARLSEIDTQGPFAAYGLSREVRSRRRQLGFDPPGPLEELVSLEGVTGADAWPLWRVVVELLRKRGEPWRAVHAKLVAAAPALGPKDWLSVWFETSAQKGVWNIQELHHPYGALWNHDSDLLPALLATTPDADRLAWAAAYHQELRRWPRCFRRASCRILHELVVRGLSPGEDLPEEYDADIAPGFKMPVREVLERVPESRRVPLLRRLVESNELDVTTASSFLDLAPELLPTLYENLERRKGYEYMRTSREVFNDDGAFLRLMDRDSRLREIHEAYMSSPPLPEQPPPHLAEQTQWP
jgi:hypothetical protein